MESTMGGGRAPVRWLAVLVAMTNACGDAGPPRAGLRSAGDAPRRVLRYELDPSVREELTLELDVTMTLRGAGAEDGVFVMPTVFALSQLDVVAARLGGPFRYELTMRGFEARDRETIYRTVPAADLAAALAPTVGATQVVTLDTRGATQATRMRLPTLPPAMREVGRSLEASLVQLLQALPDGAVGIGGTWRVDEPMEAAGVRMIRRETATVTALSDDEAAWDLSTEIRGSRQTIRSQGVDVEVRRIGGAGQASVVLRRGQVTPTLDRELTVELVMAARGQEVSMTLELGIRIYPGDPPPAPLPEPDAPPEPDDVPPSVFDDAPPPGE